MKTTILFFVLIFGYLTPTYSQINLHRKSSATPEQFHGKKNDDFGNNKFVDKFIGSLSEAPRESFNMSPLRPARSKFPEQLNRWDVMPCFHPKSGDNMPCLKPEGTFPMRVFDPKNVIWGILW